jgi:hypothetical protein
MYGTYGIKKRHRAYRADLTRAVHTIRAVHFQARQPITPDLPLVSQNNAFFSSSNRTQPFDRPNQWQGTQ